MRTLHFGIRVSDLERSLAFYTAVGYTVVGTVKGTAYGTLTMLQLPGDPFVTIEPVFDPANATVGPGNGFNHMVIQVDSLEQASADLTRHVTGSRPSRSSTPAAPPDRGAAGSPTRTTTE